MARSFKQRGTVVVPLAESPIPMVEVESIDNPAIFSETVAGEGNITGLTVYGKSTQDGTPSPESPVPIVSAGASGSIETVITGKNLLTGRLYYGEYSRGTAYIQNKTEVSLPYTPSVETQGVCYTVSVKKGVTYTFSVTNPNTNAELFLALYRTFEDTFKPTNSISHLGSSPTASITPSEDGILVCLIAGTWTDGTTTTHECTASELLQLEVGSTATAYEAPHSQSIVATTPNGLPGIPVDSGGNYTDADGQQWVCDEIDYKNEAYIKNLTLIPDLSIGTFTKHVDGMFICDVGAFSAPHGNSNVLSRCTHFPSVNSQSFYGILVSSNYVIIGVALAETFDNVDDFNNFLLEQRENNTPVQLLYYQNESIETPLLEDELAAYRALHTYDGTTVISVNSDPIVPGLKSTVKIIDPNSGNPQIMQLWLDKEGHPVNINGRGARVGGTPTQQYILQPCSF